MSSHQQKHSSFQSVSSRRFGASFVSPRHEGYPWPIAADLGRGLKIINKYIYILILNFDMFWCILLVDLNVFLRFIFSLGSSMGFWEEVRLVKLQAFTIRFGQDLQQVTWQSKMQVASHDGSIFFWFTKLDALLVTSSHNRLKSRLWYHMI